MDDAESEQGVEGRGTNAETMDAELLQFEDRLRSRIIMVEADAEFWEHVASDLQSLEACMDAAQVQRFEISVDGLLSRLGLPA